MDARTTIFLSENPIGDKCLHVSNAQSLSNIFTLLSSHPEIIKLEVKQSEVFDKDIEALAKNRQLQSIVFHECNVDESKAFVLAESIPTLTVLEWDKKNIDANKAMMGLIESSLKAHSDKHSKSIISKFLFKNHMNIVYWLPDLTKQIEDYLIDIYRMHLNFLSQEYEHNKYPNRTLPLSMDLSRLGWDKNSEEAFKGIQKILNNKSTSKKDPLTAIKNIAANVLSGKEYKSTLKTKASRLFKDKVSYDPAFIQLCTDISKTSSMAEVAALLSKGLPATPEDLSSSIKKKR